MAAFVMDTISKKNNDMMVCLSPSFAEQCGWQLREAGVRLKNTAMIALAGQLFAGARVLEGEKEIEDFDFFSDVAFEDVESEEAVTT